VLEYVRTQDMTAYVRKATKPAGVVPAWAGSKMPLSSELADAVQAVLDRGRAGRWPQLQGDGRARAAGRAADAAGAGAAVAHAGARGGCWSSATARARATTSSSTPLPAATCTSGWRSCWPGGWRARSPTPSRSASTTYGLEIVAPAGGPGRRRCSASVSAPADLLADVLASLNSGELAQRRFREIARVAGLVFTGYPGAPKSLRQLQASSSLFYEVFRKYDAGNRLLAQAEPRCWRRSWTSAAPGRHAAALAACRWTWSSCGAQPVQRCR
jgi:ATP-dependent Lhr-like helicase